MTDSVPTIGWSHRLAARLPLRARRRAVRVLHRIGAGVGPLRRGEGGTGLEGLFRRVLRLPRREARALAREAAVHDAIAEVEWHALRLRSLGAIRRDLARIRVSDADTLERVAATGRPVILAPLHMGAYVIGLAHTMLRFFPGRPFLVLRQRDDMAMETQVMERIGEFGIEIRFLNVARRSEFLAAVRFAQKGAVIVAFCDLPPSYGAPAPMPMFGLPLSFAFGLDALARLTDATVVPWASAMEAGGDVLRIGRPFEVHGSAPEERARAADLMRAHIRDTLRTYPAQWHLWPTLDDYLPARATLPDEALKEPLDDPARAADAAGRTAA